MGRERLFGPARWALGGLLGLGLTFLTAQAAEAADLRLGVDCGLTIQACVNAAAAGDVILVPRKTGKGKPNDAYYENVVVNKDVTIRGVNNTPANSTTCLDPRKVVDERGRLRRNAAAVILDAAPVGDPGGIGFDVTAAGAGATIECFLIRLGTTAIRSQADDVLLLRNAAIGQRADALLMGVTATTDDNVVVDTLVIGARGDGLELRGDNNVAIGVHVRNVNGACFRFVGNNTEDAIFVNNHARNCNSFGFNYDGINPLMVANTSDGTDSDGFFVNCSGPCAGTLFDNTASNVRDDDDGFDITTGANPNLQIIANKAFKASEVGFRLSVFDATIVDNIAERNGNQRNSSDGHGFEITGNDNLLLQNVARFNQNDGFNVAGNNNILGDNTDAGRNVSESNRMDGFDVESGNNNELNNNLARSNQGEGIENNATATDFRNNRSTGNRTDCANGGTIDFNTGNTCADGSDFLALPQVE